MVRLFRCVARFSVDGPWFTVTDNHEQ